MHRASSFCRVGFEKFSLPIYLASWEVHLKLRWGYPPRVKIENQPQQGESGQ